MFFFLGSRLCRFAFFAVKSPVLDAMSFANQVVLITGASSGIGRCLAMDFAKSGAVVIGCGRSKERLDQTLNEIRSSGRTATMIPCDVGSRDQVQSMVARVLQDFGRV